MLPVSSEDVCPHCGNDLRSASLQPAHVLPEGTILNGRFVLGKVLGQGGFGITYIGRDLRLDMRIAVKEYYPSGYANRNTQVTNTITVTDEKQREFIEKGKTRFLQEAKVLAGFNDNTGIVDVRDFFEENGTAYIVMEYLDGEDLRKILKRNLFGADEIFEKMRPVFSILDEVHKQGIIHRDISPDNIMMLKDGSLKLMDFGAARLANYSDQKSMSIVLKAGYAPEEQYRSRGKQGPWTDIYALCATIYKCITGVTPDDALDRLRDDRIRWPSEMGLPISVVQENVLKKGMSVYAEDRYRNVREMMADLGIRIGKEATDKDADRISGVDLYKEDEKTLFEDLTSDATVYDALDDNTVLDSSGLDGLTVVEEENLEKNKGWKGKILPFLLLCLVLVGAGKVGFDLLRRQPEGTIVTPQTSSVFDDVDFSEEKFLEKVQSYGQTIAAGPFQTVVVFNDGHVEAKTTREDFGNAEVSSWDDIIAVAAGEYWTFGIKRDGKVVTCGSGASWGNDDSASRVETWTGIVKIGSSGGDNYETKGNTTVTTNNHHTIGLRYDGRVVATGAGPYGECDVEGWTNIVDIAAGWRHTLGLKEDGTVVACGNNESGQCDVSEWENIVQIAAGRYCSVGLKSDGTVVIAGQGGLDAEVPSSGIINKWKNIKWIYAGEERGWDDDYVLAVCQDGTVVWDGINRPQVIQEFEDAVMCVGSSWGYTAYVNGAGDVYAYPQDNEEHPEDWNGRIGSPAWSGIKIPFRGEITKADGQVEESAGKAGLKVNSVVNFGSYEQDADISDGKEPIEWIILDIDEDKALLISRYALDVKPFNQQRQSTTWENSSIREWLNNSFLDEAFTEKEQAEVLITNVAAGSNPSYETNTGSDTKDKVFLLSISEVEEFIRFDEDRVCRVTEYAKNQLYETNDVCNWWLRSPGNETSRAAAVYNDGFVNYFGFYVELSDFAVRPAVWVDLSFLEESNSTKMTEESAIEKGASLFMGSYNDEAIEWVVLDVEDDQALVISKYALDYQPYNTSYDSVTWDTCTLRTWLNKDFLENAFDEKERSRIKESAVPADTNPEYDTGSGEIVWDKLFLLSVSEANRYFESEEERGCTAKLSIDKEKTEENCYWWLRTSGRHYYTAAAVKNDGSISVEGNTVSNNGTAVRPAMWVHLDP